MENKKKEMTSEAEIELTEEYKEKVVKLQGEADINLLLVGKDGMDDKLWFEWNHAQKMEKPTYGLLEKGTALPEEVTGSSVYFGSREFINGDMQSMEDAIQGIFCDALGNGHITDFDGIEATHVEVK